jgi:hypothetical protein
MASEMQSWSGLRLGLSGCLPFRLSHILTERGVANPDTIERPFTFDDYSDSIAFSEVVGMV